MDQSSQYSEPIGDSFQYDPDYHRMSNFLGVDQHERGDMKIAEKISALKDWAQSQHKSGELNDTLSALHELRRKVGTQSQGKTLINELYQHLRFQSKPTPTNKARKKSAAKPQKVDPITKAVQTTAEQRIAQIVARTMTNKNFIYRTVNQVIGKAFK